LRRKNRSSPAPLLGRLLWRFAPCPRGERGAADRGTGRQRASTTPGHRRQTTRRATRGRRLTTSSPTDDELEAESRITERDIADAVAAFNRQAPPDARGLLDAEPNDDDAPGER